MPATDKIVEFCGFKGRIHKEKYTEGNRTGLLLIIEDGEEAGELLATASVNLPEAELAEDEICIKNWSENEGILDVLQDAGIIQATGRSVRTGYVSAPICKLLI